jgi:hypothetical protein
MAADKHKSCGLRVVSPLVLSAWLASSREAIHKPCGVSEGFNCRFLLASKKAEVLRTEYFVPSETLSR